MGQVDSAYELQWVQTTAVCQNPQVGDDTKTLKQKTKQNKQQTQTLESYWGSTHNFDN